MASQQQSRPPLFRFASMVRPAAQPPASAPTAPSPQPMFRPTTPFRPASPAITATQPSQPQEPAPQTPATAATVVAPPQPAASAPRSPISAPQPQPVAAASPRSALASPTPRSPVVPPQSAVSPPKAPSPRSPVAAQPQRAATDVPKSPVIRATTSVPQSPSKTLATNVTTESAPTSTPYSSLPPSPKTKKADSIQTLINQSSPSKAPSPSQKVIQPNLVKSQTYSPQTKPAVSHPPSPLKLPPSQLELEFKIPPQVDQKSVVVHETTRANASGRHHVLQTTRNGKQEAVKKDKGVQQKKLSNSDNADDYGMSVLTLAGENKGAIMELSPSRKTYSPQSLQKTKPWSSEDDGEKSGSESGKKGDRTQSTSLPMTAFMNSNVQGINNSILHNASCTHHDPGVHLVFARKTNGSNGFHAKGGQKT